MTVAGDGGTGGAGGAGGGRRGVSRFGVSFRAERAALSPVRRQLRAHLEAAGLEAVADDVVLACQELMANAVVHGCRHLPPGALVTVTASCGGERVRVAVHDPSGEAPRERRDDPGGRTDGRGLRLVDALADRWGFETDPGGAGKHVWMEFDLAPAGQAVGA